MYQQFVKNHTFLVYSSRLAFYSKYFPLFVHSPTRPLLLFENFKFLIFYVECPMCINIGRIKSHVFYLYIISITLKRKINKLKG